MTFNRYYSTVRIENEFHHEPGVRIVHHRRGVVIVLHADGDKHERLVDEIDIRVVSDSSIAGQCLNGADFPEGSVVISGPVESRQLPLCAAHTS